MTFESPSDRNRAPIDVVLTCYNEAAFIGTAIESVMAQSAQSLIRRVVVVNDGSKDDSQLVLDELARRYTNLDVFHTPNRGLAAARNHALRNSSAPFVALLDGDDLWDPRKLEVQWEVVRRAHPKCAIWYGDYIEFEESPEQGTPISVRAFDEADQDFLVKYFVHDAPIIPSTTILRRKSVDQAGLFDESRKIFEDTDLWLRMGRVCSVQYIPGFLVMKRRRSGSLSMNFDRWNSAFQSITQRIVELEPKLAALEKPRRAYRLAKLAYGYLYDGQDREARAALFQSLAINPLSLKAIAYAGMLAVPRRFRRDLISTAKRLTRLRALRPQGKLPRGPGTQAAT